MSSRLKDVAARAGVSVRTVSNVVSGSAPVAAETRRRVQEAIDELGYRPNLAARSLRWPHRHHRPGRPRTGIPLLRRTGRPPAGRSPTTLVDRRHRPDAGGCGGRAPTAHAGRRTRGRRPHHQPLGARPRRTRGHRADGPPGPARRARFARSCRSCGRRQHRRGRRSHGSPDRPRPSDVSPPSARSLICTTTPPDCAWRATGVPWTASAFPGTRTRSVPSSPCTGRTAPGP